MSSEVKSMEQVEITMTGTFKIKVIADIMKQYKYGKIDIGEAIFKMIEYSG